MRANIQRLKHAARNLLTASAFSLFAHAKVLSRHGPLGSVRYIRLGFQQRRRVHVFGQGLTSEIPFSQAQRWYLAKGKPVVVALIGFENKGVAEWMIKLLGQVDVEFLVPPALVPALAGVDIRKYSVLDALGELSVDFYSIKLWLARHRAKCDLLLLDLGQPLVAAQSVVRLQHAAVTYDRGQHEIGFVTPALVVDGRAVLGYEWDRVASDWARRIPSDDYGQDQFPRYVLAANFHGLYITHRAMDQVRFGSGDATGLALDEQVRRVIGLAWRQNIRTLALPSVELVARGLPTPVVNEFDRSWLRDRLVTDQQGRRRVIFVLVKRPGFDAASF